MFNFNRFFIIIINWMSYEYYWIFMDIINWIFMDYINTQRILIQVTVVEAVYLDVDAL